MVISVNKAPGRGEFEKLLNSTLSTLKIESKKNTKKYLELLGNKLENEVFDVLKYNSVGTIFENSIELISGQKFPDIIAKKYYGVEVKTTKANHWKSTGSSVLEGTRVNGIERIFMLFGKMFDPVEFKCRPYEECLSEVVVTHSPRYLIDMNLEFGKTIFDKIDVPYDILRKQPNPIKTILNYYRKQLKTGDDVWYLEQENVKSSNLIIRMWNNLSVIERNQIMIKGFCLFPELLSNKNDKYSRFAMWLSTREGIICPNVRDIFTAGGQVTFLHNEKKYQNNPKILIQLFQSIDLIKLQLNSFTNDELSEYWLIAFDDKKRYNIWKDLIIKNANTIIKNNLPITEII